MKKCKYCKKQYVPISHKALIHEHEKPKHGIFKEIWRASGKNCEEFFMTPIGKQWFYFVTGNGCTIDQEIKKDDLKVKPSGKSAETIIPNITNKLGSYWFQPERKNILINENYAFMSEQTFKGLNEYSTSVPSGVYPGKMWRADTRLNGWLLCWYGSVKSDKYGTYCDIKKRTIQLMNGGSNERTAETDNTEGA